jgi:3-deoxy-D-arabino-heptulosonate 7-phosphate (DAHP) synthase class II
MDPNQTLANIRAIVRDLRVTPYAGEIESLADELAQMVTDLDEWLTQGGHQPTEWNQHYQANARA